jgi:hypothetical protein
VSVVRKVETLGYHELGENERRFLDAFFDAAEVLPVSQSTVAAEIRLRQKRLFRSVRRFKQARA